MIIFPNGRAMHTVSVLVIQSFNLEIIHIIQVIYRGQFPKDDFSESSEVSTYIEELSNEDTSLENLQTVTTDLEESTHQKLVATISAPPSFSPVSWTSPHPRPRPPSDSSDSQTGPDSDSKVQFKSEFIWIFLESNDWFI